MICRRQRQALHAERTQRDAFREDTAMNRRELLLSGAALALAPRVAVADAVKPLKIGVMNDMSSVYSDYQGIGSVVAARLAVDDYSAKLGVPVEIVFADHQNKPDIGAGIARDWFDN